MDQDEFNKICNFLTDEYHYLKKNDTGNVADYIPQLAQQKASNFSISICTVDGKTFNIGDHNEYFSIQSCSKPFSYCYARELHGMKYVHDKVGYEPSGRSFNAHVLNRQNLPHNPMINAGAIMISSLIHKELEPAKRFENVKDFFQIMTDPKEKILFDNTIYLSEREHGDRNVSLAYYMRESGSYGEKIHASQISKNLELYFQTCSLVINSSIGSKMAATLANGGINPLTGDTVCSVNTVRDCLSIMYSCGMYDFSGQFSFEVGLPAKSGVSGCVLLVVPGRFGMCVWSPPLDDIGNSVRGVQCCRDLVTSGNGNYHMFRHIGKTNRVKSNPDLAFFTIMEMVNAGDIHGFEEIIHIVDLYRSDYDMRTIFHIAACALNKTTSLEILQLIREMDYKSEGKGFFLQDRWGNTAIDELEKHSSIPEVNEFIKTINKISV